MPVGWSDEWLAKFVKGAKEWIRKRPQVLNTKQLLDKILTTDRNGSAVTADTDEARAVVQARVS